MKVVLSGSVIKFLIEQGYQYCLSKTTDITNTNVSVSIMLTPVKTRPDIRNLPTGFDTYFNIMEEPLQLSDGVDDTEVFINIDKDELKKYTGNICIM
jgi:hypothetical protein